LWWLPYGLRQESVALRKRVISPIFITVRHSVSGRGVESKAFVNDVDLLATHGAGDVIHDVICTDP